MLYTVDARRARLAGVIDFPPETMDGNENKLPDKIRALAGCAAVYCLAVGSSAVRQLLGAGIQPLKLDAPEPIDTLLAALSGAIASGGVPWIERLLHHVADPGRFDRMAAEGWQE